MGEDIEEYDIYNISGIIYGIKEAEGREIEGDSERSKRKEGY
jgi:hypothetical protein